MAEDVEQPARDDTRILVPGHKFPGLIYKSNVFLKFVLCIVRFALRDAHVLIEGETGTGKGLALRGLHHISQRAGGPFIHVNCAELQAESFESVMFGHVRGSFTGADRDHVGMFEQANHGILFLDEISELSLAMQAKLLCVVQDMVLRRFGSSKTVKVDVRIVSASNQNLKALIEQGRFRSDLFHRIARLRAYIPPLRERPEDIELQLGHNLKTYASEMGRAGVRFAPDAFELLMKYPYPGNSRELDNIVYNALVLDDSDEIGIETLLQVFSPDGSRPVLVRPDHAGDLPPSELGPFPDYERTRIREALANCAGDLNSAARDLGLPLPVLRILLFALGVSRDQPQTRPPTLPELHRWHKAASREAEEVFERELIAAVLRQHQGDVDLAARQLGVSRWHLYRRVRHLGIDLKELHSSEAQAETK